MPARRTVAVMVNGNIPGSRYFVNLDKGYYSCPAWKYQKSNGHILMQFVLVLALLGIVAAIALPRFVDYTEAARQTGAAQFVDAGNEALRIDFANQIMESGTYTSPFSKKQKGGKNLQPKNVKALEALLEIAAYPDGFQWTLAQKATSSNPPIVGFRWKK